MHNTVAFLTYSLAMVKSHKALSFMLIYGLTLFWCYRISQAVTINHPKRFLDFLFSSCNCKCGIPNREARLLGGEYLRSYEFPWLVLIQIKGINSIPGTLINDRYVITSASPLIGLTPYDIKITLGQFDRCFPDTSSLNVSITSIVLHQEFNPGNRAHDIALLKLATILPFEKRMSPICLSAQGVTHIGQVATTVGWTTSSISKDEDAPTCRPRKLGLPVLDHAECTDTAFDAQYLSYDKRCLGIVGAKSLVCQNDGGSPVMYRSYGGVYELIGILIDKNSCSDKPSTALYTSINDHLPWISRNTLDACYCRKS